MLTHVGRPSKGDHQVHNKILLQHHNEEKIALITLGLAGIFGIYYLV